MSQKGFTLLEVLVALAIVATVLVVFTGRLGSSADLQYEMRLRSQALEIGMEQLERGRIERNERAANEGEMQIGDARFEWKLSEKSGSAPGLLYQQVIVMAPEGVEVSLSRELATP